MKKVLIETKHFAHISIITSDMKHYDEAKDEIEGFVKTILGDSPRPIGRGFLNRLPQPNS